MKTKKIAAFLMLTSLLLSGCGSGQAEEEKAAVTPVPEQTSQYKEKDFSALPDEGFFKQDILNVTSIERDMDGRPAMYMLEAGTDDEDDIYAQILQYSLTAKGEWEMNVFAAKSLTKLAKKAKGKSFSLPYIVRGDDGNLYALLQTGTGDQGAEMYEYTVVQVEEDKDGVYPVSLNLQSSTNKDINFSGETVTKFHVMEDGTPLVVFNNGTAVTFDPDTGEQVAECSTVPDGAFDKNVGYGEKDFVFYSVANKIMSILDLDTMTVTGTFGDNIDESYRGREWYYDTHTEDWQMYAFNTSGLYRITEAGKNAMASCLSVDGSFDSLMTDTTIYDALVDSDENVYVLVRKKGEESYSYQGNWEFGVVKFEKQ